MSPPAKYYHYLVKYEQLEDTKDDTNDTEGEWCISHPPLIVTNDETGMVLQALRDIQFSLIAAEGTTKELYLVKSAMSSYELITYFRTHPDWLSCCVKGTEDPYLVKSFNYVIDSSQSTQSGLSMTYHVMKNNRIIQNGEDDCQDSGDSVSRSRDSLEPKTYFLCWPIVRL